MPLLSNPLSKSRTEGKSDAVKLLVNDHEKAEALFAELEQAKGESVSRQLGLRAQLVAELRAHMEIEEQMLYPFVIEHVPDGGALVYEAKREHGEARATIQQFETADPSTSAFDDLVRSLQKDVEHHVHEEEREILPKLENAVDETALTQLFERLQGAKLALQPTPQLPDSATGGGIVSGRTASSSGGSNGDRATTSPNRSTTSTRASVWVQPHRDGERWQVRRENATRASRVFDTQREARDFAVVLAKRERVELVVTGADGAIRERNSYGKDPTRSKG